MAKMTERAEPAVVNHDATPLPVSRTRRLRSGLKLAILVVVSSGLQMALRQSASNIFGNELGTISRRTQEDWEPFAALAYQIGLLGVGWYLSYDVIDISALTLLINTPFTYLITTYYGISPLTASISLGIQIVSAALPTYLLRPFADHHSLAPTTPNRFLLSSFQVQSSTALLAIATYVVTIWGALKTNLNTFLISHFDDVPTLVPAHNETPMSLISKTLLVGWAAQGFLLNSSLGAQTGALTPVTRFDPAKASLSETLKYNVWSYDKKTKALIKRTTTLALLTLVHTVQKVLTVEGTDVVGAAGYAGYWVGATVLCSALYAWVENA